MSRELIIMRHAKSDWNHTALSDFERPLNKRGQASAPKIGYWLRQQGLLPDHVVSSPAIRAKQTANLVCAELGFSRAEIRWDGRIYDAALADLLAVLTDCPNTALRVLLIGHNPGLEYLLMHLHSNPKIPHSDKLMPTAAVGHMQLPDDWHQLDPACGQLLTLQHPRELPD